MKAPFTLEVGRGLIRVSREGLGWAAEAEWQTYDDLVPAIASLVHEPVLEKHGISNRVKVALCQPVVQLRTLPGLPPVGLRDLKRMVAEQAPRFFRGPRVHLITDAIWISAKDPAYRIARAAGVEKAVVDGVLVGAQKARLSVVALGTMVEGGRWLNLLPGREGAGRGLRSLRLWAFSAVGVVILLAGLFGYTSRETRRLDHEIAALRPTADALGALSRNAEAARRALEAVAGARQTRRDLVKQLYSVIAPLPDSAYLTAVSIAPDGKGSLEGLALRPSEVLASLATSRPSRTLHLDSSSDQLPTPLAPWSSFSIQLGPAKR
ncbi:MAG TPA: hypothetical protein VFU03_09995 [Gemmatimonadales bacterium]|nr:hypothetical protein [Gemmatimonadales bacterium]